MNVVILGAMLVHIPHMTHLGMDTKNQCAVEKKEFQ